MWLLRFLLFVFELYLTKTKRKICDVDYINAQIWTQTVVAHVCEHRSLNETLPKATDVFDIKTCELTRPARRFHCVNK
jgi:hypothetical protein